MKGNLLITGEIDLLGNVLEIGGFENKIDFYLRNKSTYDYFIIPDGNLHSSEIENESNKIIGSKNIKELIEEE